MGDSVCLIFITGIGEIFSSLCGQNSVPLILGEGEGEAIVASIGYWFPRVAASFGQANSPRYEMQKQMGLRQRSNDEMRAEWEAKTLAALDRVGIQPG